LFDNVIRAVGERCYLVHFDDGQERECASNILKVESSSASIPLDMPLPTREVVQSVTTVEKAAGNPDVLDSEEAKDMLDVRPEEEEAEAAEVPDNAMEVEADTAPGAVENGIEGTEGNEAVQNNNAAEGTEGNGVNSGDIHDPDGRMPGQLPTEASATVKDYHSIKKAANEKIAALVGSEVTVTSRKNGALMLAATHFQEQK
jgi:hypothetical protein